jgi:hypothetical protein
MRRDLAVFLVSGAVLVLTLEARTTLACVREGIAGPYPDPRCALAPQESPATEPSADELAAADPRRSAADLSGVPALLLPSLLLAGF